MRQTRSAVFMAVATLFVGLTAARLARAQAQPNTGQIVGKVVDMRGAGIRGATVTATRNDTGLAREATTNEAGEYRLASLPAGRYSLAVRRDGYKSFAVPEVVVDAGAAVTQNATLSVSEVEAAVGITSASPLPQRKRGAPSPEQLKKEAAELSQLADSVPADIERASKGRLSRDLEERLKRIEQLSKKLRRDLSR